MTWSCFGQIERSIIMNGSFEYDGEISVVDAENAPRYWSDINLPAENNDYKFEAGVLESSPTQGDYSLRIVSVKYGEFHINETGWIAQKVNFDEANEIIFDIRLDTQGNKDWNPALRSAVIMIDSNVVWESNSVGDDVRGEYLNQSYTIDPNYKDGRIHTLALGLRVNSLAGSPIVYQAEWDFIKFNVHCGGFGYLTGDINQDCYVDLADYAQLADEWMKETGNIKKDMDGDGYIDEYDVALFAEDWLYNTDWKNWGQANTYMMELLEADIDLSGDVDYGDIAMLSANWLSGDVKNIANINPHDSVLPGDPAVNFVDYSILLRDWGMRSWLFYAD